MKVHVITVSDRAFRGEYEDLSGPKIVDLLVSFYSDAEVELTLVSDEPEMIRSALDESLNKEFEIVLTTGGTGFSPRDNTPEVSKDFCDREAPGIAEYLRLKSLEETNRAALSRGYAGLKDSLLLINLPGSLKAVTFCLKQLEPILPHAIDMIKGKSH